MKTKLLFALSSLFALSISACNTVESFKEVILKTGDTNTVYLVLSSIGLYQGSAGENIESLYLENAVAYTALVDSDLPGADQVTSIASSNSTFSGWISYDGDGAPTTYTKVPNVKNKILYAQFTKTGNSGGSSDPTPTNKRIYCKVAQSWWKSDNAAVGAHMWGGGYDTIWPGVAMSKDSEHEDTWYIDIDMSVAANIIFTRISPSDGSDWGAKTKDLLIPTDEKNLFTITSSTAVWGDPGVDGEWSVLS